MAELGISGQEFNRNAVVKYVDCAYIAQLIDPVKQSVCDEGYYEKSVIQLTEHHHDEEVHLSFTIIGNQCENPELLS